MPRYSRQTGDNFEYNYDEGSGNSDDDSEEDYDQKEFMVIRIALSLTGLPWSSELLDSGSSSFKKVANNLRREVGAIYANFPGPPVVTVLNFSSTKSSDETLVKLDLSADRSIDIEKLKFALESKLQKQIGPYVARPAGQNWWRIFSESGNKQITVSSPEVKYRFIRGCTFPMLGE